MAGHMANPSTKFEDSTAIRYWVMSSDISRRIPLAMRLQPLRMQRITWPIDLFITGSIARSAARRYLSYSEADPEGFRPAGATRCTGGVKFGTGPLLRAKFHPLDAPIRV